MLSRSSRILAGVVTVCAFLVSGSSPTQAQTLGVNLRLETGYDSQLAVNTWSAWLDIADPGELTAGLDAIQFNVRGLNGVQVTAGRVELPIVTEGDFQRGFFEAPFRSDGMASGDDWIEISGAQPLVVEENPSPESTSLNILVGEGKVASVQLGSGEYQYKTGAGGGGLLLESTLDLTTLLPAQLPAPGQNVQRIGPDYIQNNLVLVGQSDWDSLNHDGLLSVAEGASANVVDLDAEQLDVSGILHADDLLVTSTGQIDFGGRLSLLTGEVWDNLLVNGEMWIDADNPVPASLSSLSIGATGQVFLTSDPLTDSQMNLLLQGASYQEVMAVPEPASLSIFALGSWVCLRRRRRRRA